MLTRLLEQRKAVTLALAEATDLNVAPNLTVNVWQTAEELVAALKLFRDATVVLSSATYPMLSMILPVVDGLKDFIVHAEGGLDNL